MVGSRRRWSMLVLLGAMACGSDDAGDRGDGADAIDGSATTPLPTGGAATGDAMTSTAAGGTATSAATSTTMAIADESAGGDPPKFDVDGNDVPPCAGGGGLDFSYIWIANSAQGTVSKLDTQTMAELGRYRVRPDSAGNPSRTSVGLTGDVVVANRYGGLTKLYARTEDCVESNGMPGIQTSSGAGDILGWGVEECIAWYLPVPQNQQRPVAWTFGTFDESSCSYVDQRVWTTVAYANSAGTVVAMRVDAETGIPDIELPIPEVSTGTYGPYGGAVDANSDFWFHSRDAGIPHPLVHVDADGLSYEVIPVPDPVTPYGITVDSNNRIWLAGYQGGIGRYDPVLGTWDTIAGVTGLGIQEDAFGRMWMAIYPWSTTGVVAFDVNTMAILQNIDMTGVAPESRGISIDFEGYVWMVDQSSSAFKIDPAAGTWQQYAGLTGPYTYSDMTGWGLNLVAPG